MKILVLNKLLVKHKFTEVIVSQAVTSIYTPV